MVDLVVIALISVGLGMIVWAADKRHEKYGAVLAPAAAVIGAMLTWILTVAVGLGYISGWIWVPWIASLLVGVIVSVIATQVVGRSRSNIDTAQMTAILLRG
ncbi:hypothetical protein RSal33209_1212 [Renibacterium salmoninarum ATCC 33209]|uniref:Integral membrane protein n=1 Tax=Renibacterium salmoninarum (strain ATCC 33209 / DSM 20767 / JCM 11484 / NBRC 15589 / NCIMB 2235) TaxID=288705 RepID=A9WPG5_RENSM|nr:hypothetical protein [Renibacterium salmoninarum]ABY22950.1 hypothetical protein RSal33209_1212 [Renibacterium salmoninarum ATCC 33209]